LALDVAGNPPSPQEAPVLPGRSSQSHVIEALPGHPKGGGRRISLGRTTSDFDVKVAAEVISKGRETGNTTIVPESAPSEDECFEYEL